MFNTNVGHYFTKCVIIYSIFYVDCGVHGFYNLLEMWYPSSLVAFPKIVTWDCVKSILEIDKVRIETSICK